MSVGFVSAGVALPSRGVSEASAHQATAQLRGDEHVLIAFAPALKSEKMNEPALAGTSGGASQSARVNAAPSQLVRASPPAATFDAEFRLISRAKSELDAHAFARARANLDEHQAKFPDGVFAAERDGLRVLVTCEQGPKSPALAAQFAAQHPGSPLAPRLEQACRISSSVPSADFSKLPNGSSPREEPTTESSAGENR
ncbi:MAG TPA: hypothetical protein VHV51_26040 [Polyangiaceae bacterium]|nr:hypothetical protein [Polyangiaceae bacterium]